MNRFFQSHLFRSVLSFNRALWTWNFPSNRRGFCDLPESWKSMTGLVRCPANDVPLSPISFLERTAKVYRDTTSIVYGSMSFTWEETYNRCLKLASAMTTQLGISSGQVVSCCSDLHCWCCDSVGFLCIYLVILILIFWFDMYAGWLLKNVLMIFSILSWDWMGWSWNKKFTNILCPNSMMSLC